MFRGMKAAIVLGKFGVLALWAWGAAAFIAPASVPAPDIGRMVLLGLLAVHVAEMFAFTRKLAASGGTMPGHAWQLLVFGFLHVLGHQERGKAPA